MFIRLLDYWWVLLLFPLFVVLVVRLNDKLYYGIYTAVALLPLEDLTTLFTNFTIIKLIIIVTFAIWAVQIAIKNRKPHIAKYILLIIVLDIFAGFSLVWSINISSALTSLFTFTQLIIWLIMIVDLLDTEKKLQTAAIIYIMSSIIVSIVAIYLTRSGVLYENRAAIFQGQDPNGFSRSIGIAFLMVFYSINSRYFIRNNLINIIGTFIIGLAMLLAQSRGTYIALLLALVPLLFGPKIKHKLRTIMILAVLFIILYTFFQNILVADIIPRILNYETLGGRTDIWSVAIQMIKDHLLVGVGFGNFSDMFGSYSIVLRGWYANTGSHNVYVEILADLGIIGSSIFILFQLYILGKIIYSSGDSTIKYFLFALFTYLIVGGMTTDLLLDKAYWFGFGLIIAFVLVRNRSTQKLSLSYTKIEVRTS